MFVTNLKDFKVGVDGIIILKPSEENRFIPDTPDLTARVKRLVASNYVSAVFEDGLEKPESVATVEEVAAGTEVQSEVGTPPKTKSKAKKPAVATEEPAVPDSTVAEVASAE